MDNHKQGVDSGCPENDRVYIHKHIVKNMATEVDTAVPLWIGTAFLNLRTFNCTLK